MNSNTRIAKSLKLLVWVIFMLTLPTKSSAVVEPYPSSFTEQSRLHGWIATKGKLTINLVPVAHRSREKIYTIPSGIISTLRQSDLILTEFREFTPASPYWHAKQAITHNPDGIAYTKKLALNSNGRSLLASAIQAKIITEDEAKTVLTSWPFSMATYLSAHLFQRAAKREKLSGYELPDGIDFALVKIAKAEKLPIKSLFDTNLIHSLHASQCDSAENNSRLLASIIDSYHGDPIFMLNNENHQIDLLNLGKFSELQTYSSNLEAKNFTAWTWKYCVTRPLNQHWVGVINYLTTRDPQIITLIGGLSHFNTTENSVSVNDLLLADGFEVKLVQF